jgi:type II secretory pathway predicted ATPase ExeA
VSKKILALYGLKWNPFLPEIPLEAIHVTPRIESFCFRVENGIARDGAIVALEGDNGNGKSVTTRVLHARLSKIRDVKVRSLARPRCGVADFYREIAELFDVPNLKPHNRWCGFKTLRERWEQHIQTTLTRPLLIVDEAQDMKPEVFMELRALSSADFDSRCLLGVILAGDRRLTEALKTDDLRPIASRLRTRLAFDGASPEELLACLKHVLETAGNAKLMTDEVARALAEHALGNCRQLMTLANELLAAAAEREAPRIDEKLFFEVFQPPQGEKSSPSRTNGRRR